MLSREASSETYGPRVYLFSFLLSIYFYLHLYFSASISQNTKNIIISLSDLTFVSDHEGIDNPYLRWLRGFIYFVQVRGTRA